jgi:hypothetical protein
VVLSRAIVLDDFAHTDGCSVAKIKVKDLTPVAPYCQMGWYVGSSGDGRDIRMELNVAHNAQTVTALLVYGANTLPTNIVANVTLLVDNLPVGDPVEMSFSKPVPINVSVVGKSRLTILFHVDKSGPTDLANAEFVLTEAQFQLEGPEELGRSLEPLHREYAVLSCANNVAANTGLLPLATKVGMAPGGQSGSQGGQITLVSFHLASNSSNEINREQPKWFSYNGKPQPEQNYRWTKARHSLASN